MDVWEHEGRRFEVVLASDVQRDGMGLELRDLDLDEPVRLPPELDSDIDVLIEAFWHDGINDFEFIIHSPGRLPLAVVERFVASAKKRLPPTQGG